MPREFMVIFLWNICDFGKKNQRKIVPEGPTSQGARPTPWACRAGLWAALRSVGALLSPQES